jgi:hypothetical protein
MKGHVVTGVLDEEAARQILGPHESSLQAVFQSALWRYLQHPPADRAAYTLNAEATIFNSFLLDEARKTFANTSGISFHNNQLLEVINFLDLILLRFKRVDENFRTSNNPTSRSEAFSGQSELEGLPPVTTHLNAGYRLNEIRTRYAGAWLICPNRTTIRYKWSILGPDQDGFALPNSPLSPYDPSPPVVRVKPTTDAEKHDGTSDAPR